jgi:hypothetical protein
LGDDGEAQERDDDPDHSRGDALVPSLPVAAAAEVFEGIRG